MAAKQTDVLIVGGGMAGGMLAAALKQGDLGCVVLDQAPAPQMPKGEAEIRVSAITEASMHMLANVGAWQRIAAERAAPYQGMDVWDGDGTGRVSFDAAAVQASALGWIVENAVITAALYQSCEGIDWRAGAAIADLCRADDGWHARLANGDEIVAELLVGADGARSMVRERAGIAAAPKDSGHIAIVATIHSEMPHGAVARQRFLDTGPLALLPLFGDGNTFSLVWSAEPVLAKYLMDLDDAEFSRQLTLASESVLGRCELVGRRGAFPIHTLHASEYIADGLALIGDAAHVVHPLAGQGINLGFLDAAVLAEELTKARQRGLLIADSSVLRRYQRRRRAHNAVMLNALNGIKALFGQRDPGVRLLRNMGMNWVNRLPMAKSFFANEALGRNGDLPALARRSFSFHPHDR